MVVSINATIPTVEKACAECGRIIPCRSGVNPSAYMRRTFCGQSCSASHANRKRADHSELSLMRRFWAKVDKTAGLGPAGECWEWRGRVDGRGYGEIKVGGRYKKSHRIALFGLEGLNSPLFACHRCDNPRCVRSDHLFAGEPIDNVADMHAKGRSPRAWARKLTEPQVRLIRQSSASVLKLAKRYGVNETAIRQVRRGATYKDVT